VIDKALKVSDDLLAIAILIITILNCSYANAGPEIGPNQAKTIVQDYLNSHNLPYTAITPGWNAWKFYVKDTKTGEKKWLPAEVVMLDDLDFGGSGKYKIIPSIFNNEFGVWFVQVNNKNGKKVGQIYVDDTTGKVLKVAITQKSQTKSQSTPANTTNITNTTNATFPLSQEPSSNNTGIIFGIIALLIAIGAGYFMYTRI